MKLIKPDLRNSLRKQFWYVPMAKISKKHPDIDMARCNMIYDLHIIQFGVRAHLFRVIDSGA